MKVERLAVWCVCLGVALRFDIVALMDLMADGNHYAAMGKALADKGGFLMPWGDVMAWGSSVPGYSHHFQPVYPFLLGMVYGDFGFGVIQTKAVALAISLASLGVVWACTRNLFGLSAAWLATGLVAVSGCLLWTTGAGYGESLSVALFTLTLWAILRGLKEPHFMPLAGLFAGLGYLARSGMGVFFFVAGLGGALWRLKHKGGKGLVQNDYLVAIGIFGAIAALWTWRNLALFGWPNWQTSEYNQFVLNHALHHLDLLAYGLGMKLALFCALLAPWIICFRKEIARSFYYIWTQEESGLWLAIGLVSGIGLAMAAIFWTFEQTPIWWMDNERYLVLSYVPLAWVVVKNRVETDKSFGPRYAVMVGFLVIGSGYVLLGANHPAEVEAVDWLNPELESGDTVAVAGNLAKYSFFTYLERFDITIVGCDGLYGEPCSHLLPKWIMATDQVVPSGPYQVVHRAESKAPLWGDSSLVLTYRRIDT